jgi:hypothetical protein
MINKTINKITDKPQYYKIISTIFKNNKRNKKINNRFLNNNIAKVLKISKNLIKIKNNNNNKNYKDHLNNNNNNKDHNNNNNNNNSNRYNNNKKNKIIIVTKINHKHIIKTHKLNKVLKINIRKIIKFKYH